MEDEIRIELHSDGNIFVVLTGSYAEAERRRRREAAARALYELDELGELDESDRQMINALTAREEEKP